MNNISTTRIKPILANALLLFSILFLGISGTIGGTDHQETTRDASLPTLNDTTTLPEVIQLGDIINFTVLYRDADGDAGDVRIMINMTDETRGISGGGSYHEMNYNVTGNFTEGVVYWYERSFDNPGIHTYTFNVTDAGLNQTVVENGTNFNVILPVPTEGKISGFVTTGEGNATVPLSGVDVIIFHPHNLTGNITYYNTTTNATGYYESVLPIKEGSFGMYANKSGYLRSETYNFTIPTIENEKEKNFTLKKIPKYSVTGAVIPADATIIFSDNLTVTHNKTSGNFTIDGLLDGDYKIILEMDGYVSQAFDVKVNGSNVDIGEYTLLRATFTVIVGPLLDEKGVPVTGATVSFVYENDTKEIETDANGNATFADFPVDSIPGGIILTATLDDITISWTHGEDIPEFKEEAEEEMPTRIIIGIIVAAILLVLVIMILTLKKN